MPLSTIFQLYRESDLLVEETRVSEENHQISLKYVFTQYESLTIEINASPDRTSHTSSLRNVLSRLSN